MKKHLIMCLAVSACMSAGFVHAEPGESWEVTSRTDMPGMPLGMGEATTTICIPKGTEKDPKQLMKQAGDCEVTDIKTVGSKTTWKMRCDKDGDILAGKGEIVHKTGSYQGVAKLAGTANGQTINMTTNYQGKRIGSTCDTSEAPVTAIKGMEGMNEMMGLASKQMASAMAEQCEVSNYRAVDLISNKFFGPAAACPGKEKFACKIINKNVAKNADAYVKLAKHDDTSETSIAKACAIDMEATTKAICKIVDSSNYQELAEFCPEEARDFGADRTKSNRSNATGSSSPANSVLDGAIKLKSLFGF